MNILTSLEKEVAKGNQLMKSDGTLVTLENAEKAIKKSYLAGLKDESISFEKTFEDYKHDVLEKEYMPVSVLTEYIRKAFAEDAEDAEDNEETTDYCE